jgi:hypothetical protein
MFDFDQHLSNADWVKQTDDSMAAVMEARTKAYEDEEDDDEEEEKEDYRRALNREFYRRGFYGKDFKEGEHPRDEGGKFSSGGAGRHASDSSLSTEDAVRMMKAAVEYAKKFDKKQFGTPDVVSPPKGAESLLTDPIGTRRSGECYESAGQFMMEAALTGSGLNAKMVHGTVSMGDQRIGHGWVEIGDVVYDGTHTQFFDRDSYREFTEAETEHEYDWEECSKHMLRTENWGPWEETAGLLSEEHHRPGRNE